MLKRFVLKNHPLAPYNFGISSYTIPLIIIITKITVQDNEHIYMES